MNIAQTRDLIALHMTLRRIGTNISLLPAGEPRKILTQDYERVMAVVRDVKPSLLVAELAAWRHKCADTMVGPAVHDALKLASHLHAGCNEGEKHLYARLLAKGSDTEAR